MKKRLQTLSKHYFDDEIIAKEVDGTIHLKEGVRRVLEWPNLKNMFYEEEYDHSTEHINQFRLIQDKIDLAHQIRQEESDFNN